MQELTLTLIRLAYLGILWIFVFGAISVVRSDMFGARVDTVSSRQQRRDDRRAQAPPKKPAKPARGTPTTVVVTSGANAGITAALADAPLLIGRGSDAAIRLDDDYVSTRHARIGVSGETIYVEDLGSTNGTYIGGQRLSQPTALQLGSQVRIGKTTLELKR